MRILLNGEPRELQAPLSVTALLEVLAIDPRVVAVEVNRVVVKRARYADTVIDDAAEVEIVAFVGGGSAKAKGRWQKAEVRSQPIAGHLFLLKKPTTASVRSTLLPSALCLLTSGPRTRTQHPPLSTQHRRAKVFLAAILALSLASSATAQARPPSRPAIAPTVGEESIVVYQGWALIAAGDLAKASRHAADAVAKYPRSIAALSLWVEAEIARTGPIAGLDAYEKWLGARKIEDVYIIGRIARGVLWATARNRTAASPEALKYLAQDSDAEARAELTRRTYGGSIPDAKALAQIDEGAVRYLVQSLKTTRGSKLGIIDALVASRSRLAVQPLLDVLSEVTRPEHVAAAADGLGKLGATEASPRLRPLIAAKDAPAEVKYAAATALYRLGDASGLALIQKYVQSTHAALRLAAVEAMASQPDAAWQLFARSLTVDADPTVRVEAAKLIAPYDNVLARAVVEPELANPNEGVRAFAAQVMAQYIALDFVPLRKLLRSTDTLAQVHAAGRLLQLIR